MVLATAAPALLLTASFADSTIHLRVGYGQCSAPKRADSGHGARTESGEEVFVMSRGASLAVLAVLCGGTALAQPAPHGPCVTDQVKFCKSVQPGNGRIIDCLALHKAQLAPACKARMEPVFARREQMKKQMPPKPLPMKAPATGTQKPPAPKSSG